MYKHDNFLSNENKKQSSIIVEKVFCNYCRSPLIESNDENQICPNCQLIITKINLRKDFKKKLFDIEASAIQLLEINLKIKLNRISFKNLNQFSKKNKRGVIIKDNSVIGICLDNCELTEFPDELFYFKNLKYLSLMNTKLKNIPEQISRLIDLESIDLRKNLIEFLPDSLVKLKTLKFINLNNNLLRLLPDNIGNLVSLKFIDLENNLLYSLPESFKSLHNLKVLNLFDNQINLKLIVNKMPESILKCGIGGNSSKKSFRIIRSIFKGRKCQVYQKRNNWPKKDKQIDGL